MDTIVDPSVIELVKKQGQEIVDLRRSVERQKSHIESIRLDVEKWKQRYIGVVVAMSDPSDVDYEDMVDELERIS